MSSTTTGFINALYFNFQSLEGEGARNPLDYATASYIDYFLKPIETYFSEVSSFYQDLNWEQLEHDPYDAANSLRCP